MKVAGLFAGIGGLEAGLQRSGFKTTLLCEVWEPAATVLRSHNARTAIHSDIRDLEKLPASIDLITAGFPCQDLSQAGRTAGISGARSGLVDHVFRLVDRGNAPLVLLENVPFMLRLDRGSAMDWLAREFEKRGFRWAYRTLNSLSFLPQRRERVFMLASRGGLDPSDVLFSDEVAPQLPRSAIGHLAHGFYWTEGVRGLGWAVDAIPPLKNGSTIGIPSPPAILLPSGEIVKPDLRDAERLQGFESDWTKAAEKVSRASIRWSLVGNSVSVPVATWIGEKIVSPGQYDTSRDRTLQHGDAWPSAARYDGDSRHSVRITDFPIWVDRAPLHEFLEHDGTKLSARATRGFYLRTKTAKLRFPDGFIPSVEAHLRRVEANDQPRVQKRAA